MLNQVFEVFILNLLSRQLWILVVYFLGNAPAFQLIFTAIVAHILLFHIDWLDGPHLEIDSARLMSIKIAFLLPFDSGRDNFCEVFSINVLVL